MLFRSTEIYTTEDTLSLHDALPIFTFVVDVTPAWEDKRRSILAHRSQVSRDTTARATPLNDPEFLARIEARARHFGSQIGVHYGEPFRATEPLGFRALDALVRSARPEPGSFTG